MMHIKIRCDEWCVPAFTKSPPRSRLSPMLRVRGTRGLIGAQSIRSRGNWRRASLRCIKPADMPCFKVASDSSELSGDIERW
ncbi:hypothetical protein MXD81_23460, partial [Microbacteriaceae bacterium K1510]|nr:hypothetical protein [Microbacteriaceae bacterium K1510]